MTQTTYDISVIICIYTEDRWDNLIAAVESVQQQMLPPGEIIVVVDHNPDLLNRVLDHVQGVVAVANTEARGLSGARNSGIAAAKRQIIAFLDDDAVATREWLLLLCEAFIDPQVLGIGGAVIPYWLGGKPAWFPEEFHWVVGCSYRGMPQTTNAIRNPIGANMAIRREVFDVIGGFRSGIGRVGSRPVGCEETELCIRAHQHWPRGVFLYEPQAKVLHRVPSNRTSWRYFSSRCYAEGLSKAIVTRYVGAKDSLSSERTYALQALPRGVLRGLVEGLFCLDLSRFLRSGAILAGLMITTVGYLVGTVSLLATMPSDPITTGVVLHHDAGLPQSSKLGSEI